MHLIFFPNPRTCAVFAHWQCIARAVKMEPLDFVSIFTYHLMPKREKKHINMLLGSNPCPLALQMTAQFNSMLCSGPRTPDLSKHRRLQPDGRPLHRRRDQLHLPAHRRPLQQYQQPAPGISRKAIQETIALLQQVRPLWQV